MMYKKLPEAELEVRFVLWDSMGGEIGVVIL